MKKIMFICTGNICRSAMAEAILKKLAKEKEKDIEVYSSGIYAETGDYASYDAIEVMKEYDIDLSSHRATNIKESKIEEMDLILCATLSHKALVKTMYPELSDRIYTMKEYVKEKEENNVDIADPWGYNMAIYRKCASEIEMVLEKLIKKI